MIINIDNLYDIFKTTNIFSSYDVFQTFCFFGINLDNICSSYKCFNDDLSRFLHFIEKNYRDSDADEFYASVIDKCTDEVCKNILTVLKESSSDFGIGTGTVFNKLYDRRLHLKKYFNNDEVKICGTVSKSLLYETLGSYIYSMTACGEPLSQSISYEMVKLLKETDFFDIVSSEDFNEEDYINTHRVINICNQSGELLCLFSACFYSALRYVIPDSDSRIKFIHDNLLYAICYSTESAIFTRLNLYSTFQVGNVKVFDGELDADAVINFVKECFGDMKFDVVVGNPPYNNDMYIDFVMKGHELSQGYSLWITPAKWQAKAGGKNKDFRWEIIPYISDIVYYPEVKDVFNITIGGGVCYYLIGKTVCNSKNVINKSNRVEFFNSDAVTGDLTILNNLFRPIFDKVRDEEKFIPHSILADHFGLKSGFVGNSSSGLKLFRGTELVGYCNNDFIKKHREDIEKYKVVIHLMNSGLSALDSRGTTLGIKPVFMLQPNEIPIYNYLVLYVSDSEDICKSVISYFKTRLITFLIWASLVGEAISNKESWRFIPQPRLFDHIFTDEELYRKYNLTDDEIKIIESVIRKR